jgi:hypothetical protein
VGVVTWERGAYCSGDVHLLHVLVFEHWSNLESTVSAGIARAWLPGRDSWGWFVSVKLLRN